MENADVFLGLHDFLERMRQPSASDFVKSIKSFIVSFSNNAPDPERDSALVQEFLANMEAAFRAHPLWAGCSDDELESAGEGLEKYVMTKLFTRVFASLPDDVKADEQLSEKMSLIQQFIRPENLDIKPPFQNETSWLLAQKELQKINMYKAPRDKLVCILNCCKVINNLLLNASIASNENPPGADEFLPVVIYVTLKANPPQLNSNLLYIQRYRSQSRLVGEAAYFFTNMLSAVSFISNIDANSLSMEEAEFEKNMESARALLSGLSTDWDSLSNQSDQSARNNFKPEVMESQPRAVDSKKARESLIGSKSSEARSGSKNLQYAKDESFMTKVSSLSDIENRGAVMLLKEDLASSVFREYPYLFAHAGDLTIHDVEDLLYNYKQLVFKYVCLSKGLGGTTPSLRLSNSQTHFQHATETIKEHLETRSVEANDESQKQTAKTNSSGTFSLVSEENFESKSPQEEAIALQEEGKEETSQ
ncbi:vacuolar protein sorting-associated protein 9A [Ricinus communis]|uniref:Vacuolar protein sorting-associated protein 9A n=1 Tax=Ricinus communis TaxID=3988 RepID=B9RJC2_RICCO|nr:vacuolar protein sorting-associated protein 9A [Ricinus communis]EEF48424.1 Vacuolar protein sorting-associated protein VPS9, putative [Ricinus communis]|eukprot:XP_002513841.1 vacuolar protein sorting-associated protein 9A [Ricinus communis]